MTPGGLDRAAAAIGVASLASALFRLTSGHFRFINLPGGAVAVALVLGALAVAAGLAGSRLLALAAGIGFLVAALTCLVLVVRGNFALGNATSFSLWLGLGTGLVVLAATPREPSVAPPGGP